MGLVVFVPIERDNLLAAHHFKPGHSAGIGRQRRIGAGVIASAAVLIVTLVVAPVIAESPVEGVAAIASLATAIVGLGFLKISFVS